MPEEAARPIGAVPFHQRKELRIVTKFHKRETSAFPKERTSLSGALQNLQVMSSFLALLSKKSFQTPPERMALNNILSRSLK